MLLQNDPAYEKKWRLRDLQLFCETIIERVARVAVANPTQFKTISHSVKERDRNDVRVLAFYLLEGVLPELRMKDGTHEQLASFVQTRDKLVKLRTSLKIKVNSIL
jgi:hypothetical protein